MIKSAADAIETIGFFCVAAASFCAVVAIVCFGWRPSQSLMGLIAFCALYTGALAMVRTHTRAK